MRRTTNKRKNTDLHSSDADEQDNDLARRIGKTRREIVEKQKVKAEKSLQKAEARKDETMAKIRRKIDTDHPTQLNVIHARLLKSIQEQDELIAEYWAELSTLDKAAQEGSIAFLNELKNAQEEVDKVRRDSSMKIKGILSEAENSAAEVFRRGFEQPVPRPIKSALKEKKRPRRTDTTLVDSE